ncbi:MAG TPA: RluA family pseudouridine synthase [Vicinamibacterales bacterium]|nr:RluA family pseudouridine synthase [Vicinamibacterales bacterium]
MARSEWTVDADEVGLRLDKYLAAAGRLGSRARAVAALERGKVFHNGRETALADASLRLNAGDAVRVWMDRPGSAKAGPRAVQIGDLQILFEDAALLVVNKPAGLLAVPLERKADAPSVYAQIEDHFRSRGKRRPLVVHRIDRDTSGLVVFAKDARSQSMLKVQFKRREPERVYWAVVYGAPDPPAGTWRDHLVWDTKALIQKETSPRDPRASDAISDYRVLERFRGASLIEVRLRTGRRNQIRIQARLRGHTLVGEKRYVFGPEDLRTIQFERQALHAYRLAFLHPHDGRTLAFEAPIPPDFASLLNRLRSSTC